MDLMKVWLRALVMAGAMSVTAVGGLFDSAHAALVTQLDFTSGAVNWSGPKGKILDDLFAQDGVILAGQYQGFGQIVDSITKGDKTFSLFTSGLTGAPTPSGTVTGNTIVMDLSSLFFGSQRGDQIRALNIGGQATGLFNPETSEFLLSWDHLFNNAFNNGQHEPNGMSQSNSIPDRPATFFLRGTAVVEVAPIPIPASFFLFGTGLFGLGSWSRWRHRWQSLAVS
jgi:hypothetical protein